MNLNDYAGDGRGFTICAVPHCTEPHKAKRLCADHYLTWYRARKRDGYIHPRTTLQQLETALTPSRGEVCNLHGCNTPQHARGLCNKHYAQYLRLNKGK